MAYDTTRQFPQTFVDFFTRMQRQYSFQPIFLGGTTGANGGTGGNPGGFTGNLPQTRVCYDTTEAASSGSTTSGSIASLVDNLNRIRYDIRHIQEGWIPISTGLSWTSGSLTASGGTVGPGTASRIAKFITTTTIGDSFLIGPAANLLTLESSSGSLTLTAEITGTVIVRSATPNIVGGAFGATPGNARGTGAIDFQLSRTAAGQVAAGNYSAIVGGKDNTAGGESGAIVGGYSNSVSSFYAAVCGGSSNSVSAQSSGILGGQSSSITNSYSAIIGGNSNSITGQHSAVLAGKNNAVAGDYSCAVGEQVKIAAAHDGSFLFADYNTADFNSIAANEFAIRARGGVRWAYDDSNYAKLLVSSAGVGTFSTLPVGAGFIFTPAVTFTAAPICSTLTAGRVVFAGASKELFDCGSLVWNNAPCRLEIGGGRPFVFSPDSTHGLNVICDSGTPSATLWGVGTSVIPSVKGYRARGTIGSYTAPVSGDSLLALDASGWSGVVGTPAAPWTGSAAAIRLIANQDWTSTANGTRVEIRTTPNGSDETGIAAVASFSNSGITFTPAVTFTAAPILSTMTAGWLPYMGASKEIVGSANATLDANGNAYLAGNVGIGCSPSKKLDIVGDYIHMSNAGFVEVWLASSSNSNVNFHLQRNEVGGSYNTSWYMYCPAYSTDLRLYNGADRIIFTTGGGMSVSGAFGCNGAAAQTQLSVTGSRGGNAALASLLTQLAAFGLITDNTSA